MTKGAAWLVLGGAALVVMIGGGTMRQAGQTRALPRKTKAGIERSLKLLAPAFESRVEELLKLMARDGFDPLVYETWRSKEREAELVAAGTGSPDSMHGLGLGVDILDADRMWDAPPKFWQALHRHALALGLGRVKHRGTDGVLRWDLPHVQALPGEFDAQLRKLSAADANDFVLDRYTA